MNSQQMQVVWIHSQICFTQKTSAFKNSSSAKMLFPRIAAYNLRTFQVISRTLSVSSALQGLEFWIQALSMHFSFVVQTLSS